MKISHETWFIADDGSRHTTREGALRVDTEQAAVEAALAPLGIKPSFDSFDIPGDYQAQRFIQHDKATVDGVRQKLTELSRLVIGKWIHEQESKHNSKINEIHPSWFLRLIDDNSPLSKAWGRLCTIDNKYREWQQTFFVSNPPMRSKPFPLIKGS